MTNDSLNQITISVKAYVELLTPWYADYRRQFKAYPSFTMEEVGNAYLALYGCSRGIKKYPGKRRLEAAKKHLYKTVLKERMSDCETGCGGGSRNREQHE